MKRATLEVCVDDLVGLEACLSGGADRIELCSALALGGLTPSRGFMRTAVSAEMPVYAMIRPRDGDFCYSSREIDIMCDDIACAKDSGLAGVVFGAATEDARLDLHALSRLTRAAEGMACTLHRVVDVLDDPATAVESAIELGIDRVLSSGGATAAVEGIEELAQMHSQAAGKVEIMAGAGVTAENVRTIARSTGIRSFHASCRRSLQSDEALVGYGFCQRTSWITSIDAIRELKTAIAQD